jgi:hypothetical protein
VNGFAKFREHCLGHDHRHAAMICPGGPAGLMNALMMTLVSTTARI